MSAHPQDPRRFGLTYRLDGDFARNHLALHEQNAGAHVRPEPTEAPWPDERPLCEEGVAAAMSRLTFWGGDAGPRGEQVMREAIREYLRITAAYGESDGALAWRRDLEAAKQRTRVRVTVSGRQR